MKSVVSVDSSWAEVRWKSSKETTEPCEREEKNNFIRAQKQNPPRLSRKRGYRGFYKMKLLAKADFMDGQYAKENRRKNF